MESTTRELVNSYEQASMRGELQEATRLLEKAVEIAPQDSAVLNACGSRALRAGNASEAKSLFENAIKNDPSDPKLYLNLASAHRALGDAKEELNALQQALALDPYFYLANLQKASLFEKQGKINLAAGAFHAALSSMRPGLQIPDSLRPLVEHAVEVVRVNIRNLEEHLQQHMQAARVKYSDQPQGRVDELLDIYLGKKKVYVHQPTYTYFPRIPAIPFFERSDFPWLKTIEAATDDIRTELLQLMETAAEKFSPYVAAAPGTPLNQWKDLNHSKRWSALFLYKDGKRIEENIAQCPKTCEALQAAPLVTIADRAPTVFFSQLAPQTHIPPHTGVTNTRLTVHIPLIVPPGCGFRVASEVREWQPGTALVFDDSIEHEAWNNSDELRVVLIFDIWNPFLTEAERELVAAATTGIAEFYKKADGESDQL